MSSTENRSPTNQDIIAALGNAEESKRLHLQRELSPAAGGDAAEQFQMEVRANSGFQQRCITFSALMGASVAAALLSFRRTRFGACHLYEHGHESLPFLQRFLVAPLLVPSALGIGFVILRSVWFESEYRRREKAREEWEMENFREGELGEMEAIYESRGLTAEQAKMVVEMTSKHDRFFVDSMMCYELGFSLVEPPTRAESVKASAAAIVSFLVTSVVPLYMAQLFDKFKTQKMSVVPEAVLALIGLVLSYRQGRMLLRQHNARADLASSFVANSGFIAVVYGFVQLACNRALAKHA